MGIYGLRQSPYGGGRRPCQHQGGRTAAGRCRQSQERPTDRSGPQIGGEIELSRQAQANGGQRPVSGGAPASRDFALPKLRQHPSGRRRHQGPRRRGRQAESRRSGAYGAERQAQNGPRSDAPEPIGGVRPKAPRERLPYAGSAEIGGQKGRHSPRRWSEQKQAAPIGGGQGGAGAGENPAVHAMRGPDRGPQDQFQCERQREQDGPNQPTGSHKAPTGADEGGAGDQAAGQAETQSSHAASFAQHLLAQSREMPGEPIGREPKR